MRETLFRGRKLYSKIWVEGYMISGEYSYIVTKDQFYNAVVSSVFCEGGNSMSTFCFPVDKNTIGQWTGKRDTNGNRIFEGDIVKAKVNDDMGRATICNGTVMFEDFEYVIESNIDDWPVISWKCVGSATVIGNIHDEVQP